MGDRLYQCHVVLCVCISVVVFAVLVVSVDCRLRASAVLAAPARFHQAMGMNWNFLFPTLRVGRSSPDKAVSVALWTDTRFSPESCAYELISPAAVIFPPKRTAKAVRP